MVRLMTGVVVVISLGFLSQILLEEGGVLCEVLVGETSPNLANALVFLILWVIAGKEETTVTKKRKNKLNQIYMKTRVLFQSHGTLSH